MKVKILARLIAEFFRPGANTTSLNSDIALIPGGIVADNVGMWGLFGLIQNLAQYDFDLLALVSSAASVTLTAAQFVGSGIIDHSGAPAGGVTVTTPTAAQILAAMPNTTPGTGMNFVLYYMNDGTGQTITLSAGANVTLTGNNTIATNTMRQFLVNVNPNAGTVTIVNMGTQSL